MSAVDDSTLFDLPWFHCIVEYLDVPSALRLRGTCPRAREACSKRELQIWRTQVVLPALQKVKGPPSTNPHWWHHGPIMTDIHTCWLFDNCSDLEVVDLADAPCVTDLLLHKIASGCPKLKEFKIDHHFDALRVGFYQQLRGITSDGVAALVKSCHNLRHISLRWCQSVQGDAVCLAIRTSSRVSNTLQYLNLDGIPTSDVSIQSLSYCPNIRELYLRDTTATDLSPLASCKKLEVLHVCRGNYIRNEGIVIAVEGFKSSIHELCCAGCGMVDAATAKTVLQMCPAGLHTWNCVRGTAVMNRPGDWSNLEMRDMLKDMARQLGKDVEFDGCH